MIFPGKSATHIVESTGGICLLRAAIRLLLRTLTSGVYNGDLLHYRTFRPHNLYYDIGPRCLPNNAQPPRKTPADHPLYTHQDSIEYYAQKNRHRPNGGKPILQNGIYKFRISESGATHLRPPPPSGYFVIPIPSASGLINT